MNRNAKKFDKYITMAPIKIDGLLIGTRTVLYVNITGDLLTLLFDSGMTLEVNLHAFLDKVQTDFNSLFVLYDEYEKVISYGSELTLLTETGIQIYSVEAINYKNNGTSYVTLELKVL